MEKLERKVREVVEQNVSIKIQVDSLKAKQVYGERQVADIMRNPQGGLDEQL